MDFIFKLPVGMKYNRKGICMMDVATILKKLKSMSQPENLEGMARYGIQTNKAFGISMPKLRQLGKEIGQNHQLAEKLWESGYHEAKILACLISDAKELSEEKMEAWVSDFDSWDVCDQCCLNLFRKTELAHQKIVEWCARQEEFVRRAGFALMAVLAVHDKKSENAIFVNYFDIIKKYSSDERNYVKKAVNWALRQIGKRNMILNAEAIRMAKEIQQMDSKSARWIANDALRELTNPKTISRIQEKKPK
jgi:3-methyladenine DNA glycosylase AlkD